jgi:hypothetical protein
MVPSSYSTSLSSSGLNDSMTSGPTQMKKPQASAPTSTNKIDRIAYITKDELEETPK